MPFSSSSSSTCQNTHLIQPKVEKIVYTSCGGGGGSGAFDAYNGDLLDSVSILEEDKLRVRFIFLKPFTKKQKKKIY